LNPSCKSDFQISFNNAVANENRQNIIFIISSSYVDKKYISDMERADNLNLLTMGEMR